jgi:Ni2+-binding GTPase involved in maturation of urease and hydrogenase
MGDVLVVSRDARFQQSCRESLLAEGFTPHVCDQEVQVREFVDTHQQLDLVIVNSPGPSHECHQLLDYLNQHRPRISVIISCDYFSYWDDFFTWLADACVVNSGDLTELIEKSRQLAQSTKQRLSGEDFSVDWA